MLRSEGYKVHLASTGEEALIMLRTLRPALILVDIQLPGMNGFELIRRLRQDSHTQGLLVVAMTASDIKDDRDRAFEAPAMHFDALLLSNGKVALQKRRYGMRFNSRDTGPISDENRARGFLLASGRPIWREWRPTDRARRQRPR